MRRFNITALVPLLAAAALAPAGVATPAAAAAPGPAGAPVALVPRPASLSPHPEAASFRLGAATRILTTEDGESRDAARFLAGWLRQDTGTSVPVTAVKRAADLQRPNVIVLTTRGADASLGAEGYTLAAARQSVVIRAPRGAGLFYGGETLRQLLSPPGAAGARTVPAVTVRDQPRFPERSVMLDSARHYQSVAFLKRTLDLLAYHKMNTFHWHLTDDQGWRLEIKRYPRLTSVGAFRQEPGGTYGAFYTQEQVRDLVAYAAARHITIVPEIDMPAHSAALLAAYPENACFPRAFAVPTYNVAPNGTPWTPDILCAGREQTYVFVENVLTEVMALFPSRAIHIGGDECPTDRWKACPVCQAKIKAEGLKDERALQSYLTHRVAAFLSRHGRRLQGWNEIMDGGDLPRDVIVQPWNRPEATAAAVKAGNDAVVSSTRYGYFDYSYSTTPLRLVYEWEPVPAGLTGEQLRRVRGVEACLWTEGKRGDADADQFLWPRLLAVAEVGWSPASARNWDDFRARLENVHYARLAKMGLGDPAATDAAAIEAALDERSNFDPGVRIGEWVPAQMSETPVTLEWDAAPFLAGPGRYLLRFDYDAGAHGIAISEADLVRDGSAVVAADRHDGWAGGSSHGQQYALDLPAYDPKARYTFRVRLRSDGGTDSHGVLYLTRQRAAVEAAR